MSKSDLARAVEVTPGAVSAWTRRHKPVEPTLRTLRKVCRVLGSDLSEFFAPFRRLERR